MYSWWVFRVPVLLLPPFFFLDIEIIIFLFTFLILHLNLGLKTIFKDYLHDQKTKIFLFFFVRLCNFELLRYIIEFLI